MEITEGKIKSIVERVVTRMVDEQKISDAVITSTIKKSSNINQSGTMGIHGDIESAIGAARKAFEEYNEMSLEMRNKIIASIRTACRGEVENLARIAVEETTYGRYEDKVNKNILAIEKTPGVEDLHTAAQSGDNGLTIWERAPYGVIGSIAPCTNPTETIINNAIGMLAAGNAVVFGSHPAAKRTSAYTINLLNQAIVRAGGPSNLITAIAEPSVQAAQTLMKHKDINLLVVTGGPEVVRLAMTTGKKCIGAGPGNPPVVVDETADLEKAGRDIVKGASLDNNIICIDEKEIIAVSSIADKLKRSMLDNGAYELKGAYHLKKLEELILQENKGPRKHGVVNKKWIGKDADVILQQIGISVDKNIRLIVVETDENHPYVWTELLLPVIPLVRVSDVDYAIDLAKQAEHGFGHSACMHSMNVAKLTKMARVLNTAIFVKNGPNYAGLGLEGEGPTSFTIATPTGEGPTTARNFTRFRRCVLVDYFRII